MKQYKGYEPQIAYDGDAQIFHGTVANIRGAITFEGLSVEELEAAFHESVDFYLDFCQRSGIEPAKPHSGNFVLRCGSDLHGRIADAARKAGLSLNAWVVAELERALLLGADESVAAAGRTPKSATRPSAKKSAAAKKTRVRATTTKTIANRN